MMYSILYYIWYSWIVHHLLTWLAAIQWTFIYMALTVCYTRSSRFLRISAWNSRRALQFCLVLFPLCNDITIYAYSLYHSQWCPLLHYWNNFLNGFNGFSDQQVNFLIFYNRKIICVILGWVRAFVRPLYLWNVYKYMMQQNSFSGNEE